MVSDGRNEGNWRAYLKAARTGIVIYAAILFCVAASNPPPPSSPNPQTKHQSTAAQHHNTAEQTQGDAAPPIVAVAQQAPVICEVAAQAEKQSQWYTAPDWWVAGFTGLLFIATFGLWWFTGLMWRATRDMTALSVKRPWLFISGVFELYEHGSEEDGIWTYVIYSVVNHGDAPAVIEGVQCDFIRDNQERPLEVIRSNSLIVNPITGPSEARNGIQANLPDDALGDGILIYPDERQVRLPHTGGGLLMLRIKIQYRGVATKGHESAALWGWNFLLTQFEVAGGESENYVR